MPYTNTYVLSLFAVISSKRFTSTLFCPPLWGMQTNTQTSKQSDERTWHLRLSFCFIFPLLSLPLCLAQCVRPECNTLLYRETMGRQPHCQSKFILPSVWSKPLYECVYVCVCLPVSVWYERECVCVCARPIQCIASILNSGGYWLHCRNDDFMQICQC